MPQACLLDLTACCAAASRQLRQTKPLQQCRRSLRPRRQSSQQHSRFVNASKCSWSWACMPFTRASCLTAQRPASPDLASALAAVGASLKASAAEGLGELNLIAQVGVVLLTCYGCGYHPENTQCVLGSLVRCLPRLPGLARGAHVPLLAAAYRSSLRARQRAWQPWVWRPATPSVVRPAAQRPSCRPLLTTTCLRARRSRWGGERERW